MSDHRRIAAMMACFDKLPPGESLASAGRAFEAALDDPFLRYRDKITETLRFASDKAAGGDHGVEIAEMATELLGDLEVE